jgi:serine/threonine protein kinase
VTAESQEAELIAQLGKSFPSLGGPEGAKRIEGLGLYTAGAWAAGAEGMQARGVQIPTDVHAALAAIAGRVKQARRGGTTFLCHVRRGMADDVKYVDVIRNLATLFTQPSGAGAVSTASGAHPAVTHASGAHPAVTPTSQALVALGPGSSIAGYKIVEQIGEGAMGRVFKARQESLDRLVALKVLKPSLAEEDPTFIQRLQEEAKAGAKLAHKNVVGVIDQGKCPRAGVQYVAFEFVDGVTARSLLAQRPGQVMPEGEALSIALAVAEALDCAEANGMIHRDVKPENILIGKDGIPKLADLGLAKAKREREDDSQAPDGMIVGTPQFMAPEQALGIDECDIRADLFSLGITIYRLITGRFPYESTSVIGIITLQMDNDVPDPRSVNPAVSAGTAQVVAALCARERDHRYPTARAAVLDLQRVLSRKPPLGPKEAGVKTSYQNRGKGTDEIRVASQAISNLEAVEVADAPPAMDEPSQAIWRYERSGNPKYLDDAQRLYKQVATSTAPALAAMGTAGQGRVYLLLGEPPRAEELARFAFQNDPECRLALEVVADAERIGKRAPYAISITRMSALVATNRAKAAMAVGAQIATDHPKEPLHHLALSVLAKNAGDEAGYLRSLQLAWALYPTLVNTDQPLGSLLDLACSELLIDYGRGALLSGKPDLIAHSIQNIDDKGNLFAGALQMAVGTCNLALAGPPLEPADANRLRLTRARALTGLQYFAAAKQALSGVAPFPASAPREAKLLEQEKVRVSRYLSSKSSSIQPQAGAFPCKALRNLRDRIEQRLKTITERSAHQDKELVEIHEKIAQMADDNPAVKSEVINAARELSVDNPFEDMDALKAELDAVEKELRGVGSGPDDSGGGLFSMLKGAAKKAGDLAKQGQLKLKASQLNSKLTAARAIPGERVLGKLSSYSFTTEILLKHVRRGRHLGASLKFHRSEEKALLARLERVKQLG